MKRTILVLAVGAVCVPACGDSGHALIDAGQTDAAIDAAVAIDAQPDAFVDTSLMLSYEFEDSTTVVKDSSFRGKNGTLSDVAAWTADGRNGRGISMVGGTPATRFVTLPDGVLTGVEDFTISVWIKPKSIVNNDRIYDIGNGKADADNRFMFLTQHGFTPPGVPFADQGIHADSFTGATGTDNFLGTFTLPPVGVWTHIAVTGSGGNRQIYVDGFPSATLTNGLIVLPKEMEPIGSGNSWIGKSRFEVFGDPGLDATLDDFRIYNKVLTAPQIADLAYPKKDYSYWRFDEGSGQTAKDSSDNAIPTVLANGANWTTGRLGGALNLPGGPGTALGPHVALAKSPLADCTTSLTVATWVKLRTSAPFARIFDFGTGIQTFIYLMATDGVGLHLGMGKAGIPAFDLTASKAVPNDNVWHHVAVTIDPTGLVSLYLDGVSVAAPATSSVLKPSDYAAMTENWFGRSHFSFPEPNFTDPYLDGSLDDIRISCRAFTPDEIKSLAAPIPAN